MEVRVVFDLYSLSVTGFLMKQQRFSNLTVLNCHKKLTESLDVIQIANTFAGRNENRMKNFGIFTNADL